MLADGTAFSGHALGAEGMAGGEVVFNTSQIGYQEILTDPASRDQLIAFTVPHIGNYGTTPEDDESAAPRAAGLIVNELNDDYGHWRSRKSLSDWLAAHGLSGLGGADTRALALHLRRHGSQNGCLGPLAMGAETLLAKARELPDPTASGSARPAGCREPYSYAEGRGGTRAVLDFGVRRSSLDQLAQTGLSIRIWPGDTRAETILDSGAAGVFLSGGPGDPSALTEATQTARNILGRRPLLGLGLGHQILALALGGRTFKLPFGHRGQGHPVRDEKTSLISVTSQNHGFSVDPASLPPDVIITHTNAHDQTVEGLAAPALAAFSRQYHPRAGSEDADRLFGEFKKLINKEGLINGLFAL
jgi:carbamoyl-phosphate synthase small subunit